MTHTFFAMMNSFDAEKLIKMKKSLITLLVISSLNCFSETITSIKSGNWNTIQTWNTLKVPTENDTVIITHNDTININTSSAVCKSLNLQGTLFYKSASNHLKAQRIKSSNHAEITGTALGNLTTVEFTNNGILSIGKVKLIVSEAFINNFTLNFSSKSGTKNFGQLINNGTVDNPYNEELKIQTLLNNQGEINWRTGNINFLENAFIFSKHPLKLKSISFNGTLVNSDSLIATVISGGNLINKGYLEFKGKTSDIEIDSLTPLATNTVVFSYKGNVIPPVISNNKFGKLVLSCDRFILTKRYTGTDTLVVYKTTQLSLKTAHDFPFFKQYKFSSNSKLLVEANTELPMNMQLGNIELYPNTKLSLIQCDSLFITGDLSGSGKIINHKAIIYNGSKKQLIKKMNYNSLIYNNLKTDTCSLNGKNLINTLIIKNGSLILGSATVNNTIIEENGLLIIGSSDPIFKNYIYLHGSLVLYKDQSQPTFNNILISATGAFKNNSLADPIVTGNITNNGEFIGCKGNTCNFKFTSNQSIINGNNPLFIPKIKAKKLYNFAQLVIAQALDVDSFIAEINSELKLQMDSIHISGKYNFHKNPNIVCFDKIGSQNISKSFNRFHHVIFSNEGQKIIHSDINILRQLDIYEKSTFKTDSFRTNLSVLASLNIEQNGVFILGHNFSNRKINFPPNLHKDSINLNNSSFVRYAGKQNQTISCAPRYGNLTIDDGAVDSAYIILNGDTLNIDGTLLLAESSIHLNILDKVVIVKGDWNGPGNCDLTTGKFYLAGDGNSSGKIKAGSSTFIYNGVKKQRFKISKYHNVIVDKTGETFTKANIGTLHIDSLLVRKGIMNFKGEESYVDVLTIEDSVIFQSQLQEKKFRNITIKSTGLFLLDYNEIVTITGDLQCDGEFKVTDGELIFKDTLAQKISGNGSIYLAKTTINKASNNLQILTNISLHDTLQMDSGNIVLNSAVFYLQDQAFIQNENKNSYFKGDQAGEISTSKVIDQNQSNNFCGIGITINNTISMGETEIVRKFNVIEIAGYSSAYKNFNISPSINTNLHATLEMQYFKSELNNLDTNNLALWATEDGVNWLKMNGIVKQNKITLSNISSFSKWTINTRELNVLTVELISYDVKRAEEFIEINWKIGEEINTFEYLIETSSDGINFTNETTISTNISKLYHHRFKNTSTEIIHIRVSEISLNETIILFQKPIVPYANNSPKVRMVNHKIFIDNYHNGTIKIYNSTGKLIEQRSASFTSRKTLSNGTYFILLDNGAQQYTLKVLLN